MLKKIASVVLGLVVLLGLAACADTTDASAYYVAIDINPSIEFLVDEDNNVVSYKLLNEDAEMLFAEIDFIGMNVDEAVELFVQMATEAGFIDVDSEDNAVLITVMGDGEEWLEQNRNRLKEKVAKYFARHYIKGEILSEEFTQEDLVAQAQELGVSPGKLALALIAQSTDETLILEDLIALPVKDLMVYVREAHGEAMQQFSQARLQQFKQKREQLFETHRERLQEYIDNHPELTDEEIAEIVEGFKEKFRETTRNRWQERVEQWKREHGGNETPNPDETDETTEESEQTS